MEFYYKYPYAVDYFVCPICNSELREQLSFCNCEVGRSYSYHGDYFTVTNLQPWVINIDWMETFDDDRHYWDVESLSASGGPEVVNTQSLNEVEPKFRIPNRWKAANSRDDLRQSWGKTFGGLKGSSLRARGSWRK